MHASYLFWSEDQNIFLRCFIHHLFVATIILLLNTNTNGVLFTHIGHRRHSASEGSGSSLNGATGSLCDNLEMRRRNIPYLVTQRPKRITSAPPIRTVTTAQSTPYSSSSKAYQGPQLSSPSPLQRRRSFSALQQSFPSRAEMIKDIFTVYPTPQPQAASKFRNRPSSAVTLRAGKIPNLRKTNPWV